MSKLRTSVRARAVTMYVATGVIVRVKPKGADMSGQQPPTTIKSTSAADADASAGGATTSSEVTRLRASLRKRTKRRFKRDQSFDEAERAAFMAVLRELRSIVENG